MWVAQRSKKIFAAMNDDLNTPQTLRLYGVVNADLPTNAKAESILRMDQVLGLG